MHAAKEILSKKMLDGHIHPLCQPADTHAKGPLDGGPSQLSVREIGGDARLARHQACDRTSVGSRK